MKIVTRIIPGSANTTWIPWSVSQLPNQPVRLYRSRNASPTTTGDSASGRSTRAFMTPLPGKRWRTIASAQMTPKIVFAGTAIAAISTVR